MPEVTRRYVVAGLLLMLSGVGRSQSVPGSGAASDAATQAKVKALLQSPYFEGLYARTYWSLLDRMQPDGFLPESLTGAYRGMFPRTTGALVSLLLETGREAEAERNIGCVLRATAQNHMERIPRVFVKRGTGYGVDDDEAQIDGQAHVILAWARLAVKRGHTGFEDRTWAQVSALMSRTVDRTFLQYGPYPPQLGLVRNIAFEHSREGRYWDTYDLLTQSFVGAALVDMIAVAQRRHEDALANVWQTKLTVLRGGVARNMTTVRDGKLTYLEMRLPNSAAGVPYLGLGWVALSPVAAQWQPDSDPTVMANTVAYMQQHVMQVWRGLPWMPTDGYADGSFSNEIIGKGQAWEMDYARAHGDFTRVAQILQLIQVANGSSQLYMEGAWLQDATHKLSQRLTAADLPALQQAEWKTKDGGNGEQTAWWCWAMARLRKQAGLPAEPPRPSAR